MVTNSIGGVVARRNGDVSICSNSLWVESSEGFGQYVLAQLPAQCVVTTIKTGLCSGGGSAYTTGWCRPGVRLSFSDKEHSKIAAKHFKKMSDDSFMESCAPYRKHVTS